MFWIYQKKELWNFLNKNIPGQFINLHFLCFLFVYTDLIYAELNTSSIPATKPNQGTPFFTGPYLDGTGISNLTTQIGTHAYLPCKVSN